VSDDTIAGGEIAGYRLEEQIGAGGMAVVYRAHDERLGRSVALKLLAPGLAADTGFRQRFIHESRAAAAVDHPHIIPIYEAGDAGGALFIAMRYVQGGDVRSLLERDGPLSAARAWIIISQVAEALDAAHARGLIHRDVKPANMLLDASAAAAGPADAFQPADQREHVYLSDFGISKQPLSNSSLTMTGQFVGTLDYIAPEQIDGHNVDGRADLYSLGCAAYELLSGTPPFRRGNGLALVKAHLWDPPPSVTAQRDDLPAAVDRVLAAAMAKSPDERYATCAQFATDLGRALGLIPGEPRPPGPPRRAGSGQGAGGRPRPWPATELAGQLPGPGAGPARNVTPGGPHNAGPHTAGPHNAGPHNVRPPSGPEGQPQPPARRSRRMVAGAVVAAVAVAAAAVAVAVVVTSHGHGIPQSPPTSLVSPAVRTSPASPTSPSPARSSSSPSRAEATAVNKLLTSGATSSIRLTDATDNVQACTDLSRSVRQIQRVRDQRQAEYDQAQNLSTGALPGGAELKADLTQALFYSLMADNDYLTWAQQQVADCQAGSQSSAAVTAGAQARNYKAMFVSRWNPIAAQYALPPASVGSM